MSLVGYARVSTNDQSISAQVKELEQAGATRVFTDEAVSSRLANRPGWLACRDYLRSGDVLLVRRLDRLAGTERMAIEIIQGLADEGIKIKSLTEPEIDTTSPMGRALLGIVAVFAQLRVDTIRENTRLGLTAAREAGRVGGRPRVMTAEKISAARDLKDSGKSYAQIARILEVSKSSVSRYMHDETTASSH